jgi:NAD(P)H-dependent FMN reductase
MGLGYLAFLGSARDGTPPRPARLGERVTRACAHALEQRGHAVRIIDPLDFDLGPVFKPHFAYADGTAPEALQALADQIAAADGYVMVSPEYNHSLSPALTHLLNHFASSAFAFKPSVIVSYSAGQWGGVRAAIGMRAFLSELGCLPVSAMIHMPRAQEVFNEAGGYLDGVGAARWDAYLARAFDQLDWWADAARRQRTDKGPATPAFNRSPAQRNAP